MGKSPMSADRPIRSTIDADWRVVDEISLGRTSRTYSRKGCPHACGDQFGKFSGKPELQYYWWL